MIGLLPQHPVGLGKASAGKAHSLLPEWCQVFISFTQESCPPGCKTITPTFAWVMTHSHPHKALASLQVHRFKCTEPVTDNPLITSGHLSLDQIREVADGCVFMGHRFGHNSEAVSVNFTVRPETSLAMYLEKSTQAFWMSKESWVVVLCALPLDHVSAHSCRWTND